MATRDSRGGSGAELPEVVSFDIAHLTRLSWELGSRVVDSEEATRHGTWRHTRTSWEFSAFRATSNTDIVAVQTPVGRERFYGVARSDVQSALSSLDATESWRRVE